MFKRLRAKLTEDITQKEYKRTRDQLSAHIKMVYKKMSAAPPLPSSEQRKPKPKSKAKAKSPQKDDSYN